MPQGVNYTFYVKECINHTIVASNNTFGNKSTSFAPPSVTQYNIYFTRQHDPDLLGFTFTINYNCYQEMDLKLRYPAPDLTLAGWTDTWGYLSLMALTIPDEDPDPTITKTYEYYTLELIMYNYVEDTDLSLKYMFDTNFPRYTLLGDDVILENRWNGHGHGDLYWAVRPMSLEWDFYYVVYETDSFYEGAVSIQGTHTVDNNCHSYA